MRTVRSCSLIAFALAAACASARPPFAPSPVAIATSQRRVAAVDNAETFPQIVHIALFAVRDAIAGPSLDAAAAVITAANGAPFRGTSPLPGASAWLVGPAATAAVAALVDPAARPLASADVCAGRDLVGSATPDDAALPSLHTQQGADGAVWLRVGAGSGRGEPAVDVHLREPLPADGPAVLFVPALAPGVAGHAFVLRHAPADVAAASAARAAAAPPPPATDGWPRRWQLAFASVGQHNRRPPLLEIARTLGALRARDLLLVADEPLLVEATERLARELTSADADAPWPFERAMWRALLPRLERDELPDALHAACLRHLGAMADDTGALRAALDSCRDGAAFVRALRDDNVGALADHDAAWRTRGLDWLRRHGTTVPGYDPLADDDARRAALRAFLDAEAALEAGR